MLVRVGEKIDFSDLIAEHEQQHGPLWKYSANIKKDNKNISNSDRNTNNNVTGEYATKLLSDTASVSQISEKPATHITTTNTTNNEIHNATIPPTEITSRPANFHANWDSTPSDLVLYSKITKRIEAALERLNDENNAEQERKNNGK